MDLQFKKLVFLPFLHIYAKITSRIIRIIWQLFSVQSGLTILKTRNVIVNRSSYVLFSPKFKLLLINTNLPLLLSFQAISTGLKLYLHPQTPLKTFPEVRLRTKIFPRALPCSYASNQTMRIWRYACVKVKRTAIYLTLELHH